METLVARSFRRQALAELVERPSVPREEYARRQTARAERHTSSEQRTIAKQAWHVHSLPNQVRRNLHTERTAQWAEDQRYSPTGNIAHLPTGNIAHLTSTWPWPDSHTTVKLRLQRIPGRWLVLLTRSERIFGWAFSVLPPPQLATHYDPLSLI